MKNLMFIALLASVMLACQPQVEPAEKQYFTSSPEIDVTKKLMQAYLDADWDLYRSLHADTCIVMHNSYSKTMSPDSATAFHKSGRTNISNLSLTGPAAGSPVYEMIVSDDGAKWVHFWGLWKATYNPTGAEVSFPLNISFRMDGGKINLLAAIYNGAPLLAESMKAESMAGTE
ncbi:MAG: hypothetical protein ACFHWX_03625 [Bacteroidota bacterium]